MTDDAPAGWSTASLGQLASLERGKFSARPRNDPKYYGGAHAFIQTGDVRNSDGVIRKYTQTLNDAGLKVSKLFPAGTLFITIAANIGDLGVAAFPSAAPDSLVAIRPSTAVSQQWLYHALCEQKPVLESIATQNAQANLNLEKLRPFPLRIPPLNEQVAIAEALDAVSSHIANLARMIAKKQAIKQGMMQELLTGRTRLPSFVEPWLEGTFEQLAMPSRERAMPRDIPPTTPLVDLEHLEAGSGRLIGSSRASEAVSLKSVFRPGDVLFGKLRAYLRKFWYTDVSGLCTTEIWVLRARPGVHGRFVRYIVETDGFVDAASGAYGTHMPRSDWGLVRTFPVAIPPHDEQVAIAAALSDADDEIGILHNRLAKARDVKQGMMQELLTGRIRLLVNEDVA